LDSSALQIIDRIVLYCIQSLYKCLRNWGQYHVQCSQWDEGIADSLLPELCITLLHWDIERRQILCNTHCNS